MANANPPPRKPKDILERSLVWFFLGALVVGGGGALSGYFWLEGFIDGRIAKFDDNRPSLPIPIIPPGAVVAFDGAQYHKKSDDERQLSGCPEGWIRFFEAQGKFLLGATPVVLTDNPSETSGYKLRAEGGAETHTLVEAELPPHTHEGATTSGGSHIHRGANGDALKGVQSGTGAGGDGGGWVTGYDVIQSSGSSHDHSLEIGGGADLERNPHNNMPPYIALYFCKKEAG